MVVIEYISTEQTQRKEITSISLCGLQPDQQLVYIKHISLLKIQENDFGTGMSRAGGPVVPGPPFHVWPTGCYTHPILYFYYVGPLLVFGPPCCYILATSPALATCWNMHL